jgi:predicted ATP-grasp superfamily ATP-dependent carboligase
MAFSSSLEIVVLGASPTGLYAIRELALAGHEIFLVDIAGGCAFHSRYVQRSHCVRMDDLQQVEQWLLSRFAASRTRPVLLPTSDVFVEFIMKRSSKLSAVFDFPATYAGVAARLLDKFSFHDLCRLHDLPTPGLWHAADAVALSQLRDEIPYPCILKPIYIHRARTYLKGRKVLIVNSANELELLAKSLPEDVGGWVVQEIIPGPESCITLFGGYLDKQGQLRQGFTGRKLRQYPPGFGSASLVTSQPCPETRKAALEFLQKIEFRGVCGAEFKRDPRDGVLKIIEINPRPTLWFQLIHDSGCRVVEALVRDQAGLAPLPEHLQSEKHAWRYLFKDLASAFFYRFLAAGFVLPAPDTSGRRIATGSSWAVFSAADPMPVLFELTGYLKKFLRRLF